jgi:hypothetical protein
MILEFQLDRWLATVWQKTSIFRSSRAIGSLVFPEKRQDLSNRLRAFVNVAWADPKEGSRFRMLTFIVEFTRRCLTTYLGWSLSLKI